NAQDGPRTFYKRSFVNGADVFDISGGTFVVAQDQGEGIVTYAGVAMRVRGLNRYYALFFYKGGSDTGSAGNRVALVKARDEERIELTSAEFDWNYDVSYSITFKVSGDLLYTRVGKTELSARDAEYPGGGIGMVATDGSILVGSVKISPLV
ncbi:hypothetical protein PC116_g33369, partial [Phytophthora cactorum]